MLNRDPAAENHVNAQASPKPPGGSFVAAVVAAALALVWIVGWLLHFGDITQAVLDKSFGLSDYVTKQVLTNPSIQATMNHQIDLQLTSERARQKILRFARAKLPPEYAGYFREFQFRQSDLGKSTAKSQGLLWFHREGKQKVLMWASAWARLYDGDPNTFFRMVVDQTPLQFCQWRKIIDADGNASWQLPKDCIPIADTGVLLEPADISGKLNANSTLHTLTVEPEAEIASHAKVAPDTVISLQTLILVQN